MNKLLANTHRKYSSDSEGTQSSKSDFVDDIDAIRQRARRKISDGAVTAGYKADREAVVGVLNDALATEIVCALRYKRHYFMASGLEADAAAAEFREHAEEELAHADLLAERIVQLGGEPDFSPANLVERSHSDYVPASSLQEMLKENLIAERMAIDIYGQLIDFIGDDDPTTRRKLEEILATEEEHADDLASLLDNGKQRTAARS